MIVDDGGADAVKFVVSRANEFATLLTRYAGRVKVIKLKGRCTQLDMESLIAPALAVAVNAAKSSGGVSLSEFVCKGATFDSAATVSALSSVLAALPAGATVTPVKKVTMTVTAGTSLEGPLIGALAGSVVASHSIDVAGAEGTYTHNSFSTCSLEYSVCVHCSTLSSIRGVTRCCCCLRLSR